jgi:L-threonylcarbamoyladenylate synthase
LAKALQHLKDGGVIAIPTDTLYGLAADVFNLAALDRVFQIKERSEDLALPVLVSGWQQVEMVARDIPAQAEALAERFWPGALTLVAMKAEKVSDLLTAGRPTVAIRMPGHPVPIWLAKSLGRPITGTSANITGGADPSSLEELTAQIGGRVDYIVTSGPAPEGTASTIVDVSSDSLRLIREGAIPFNLVMETWEAASA